MDWTVILKMGLDLLAWARDLAAAKGISPAEFEAKVQESRDARRKAIDAQRAAELEALG